MKIISVLILGCLVGVNGFFVSPQRAIKKSCIKKQILKTVVGGTVKKNIIKKSIIKKKRKKNILKKALLPAVVGGAVVGGAAVTAGGMLCCLCAPQSPYRYDQISSYLSLTYLNISPLNLSRCWSFCNQSNK